MKLCRSTVERAAAHFFFDVLRALVQGYVREARWETFQYDS
jgi:hypothetical protein